MGSPEVGYALVLTFLAGLSTAIGGLLPYFIKNPDRRILSLGLGFSAGVMIAVSFIELLSGAIDAVGFLPANIAFLLGCGVTLLLDVVSPALPQSVEARGMRPPWRAAAFRAATVDLSATDAGAAGESRPVASAPNEDELDRARIARVGFMTATAVAIHNFPEGFAVFAGTLQSVELGFVLMAAIAVHNIPEGMAVALPILQSTGKKGKGFRAALYSGLFEPIGALVGALLLLPLLTDVVVHWVLAFVAGIMTYVSLDELLPTARAYGSERAVAVSIILGMGVMIASLALLQG